MAAKPVVIKRELFQSQAFRGLSKWGILVLMDFYQMRQMVKTKSKRGDHWHIENNGQLVYPYKKAEDRGISRRQFNAALTELIEHGFLDISHRGNGGKKSDVHQFLIDDRWEKFGQPDFKPAKNPMSKDARQGRGFQVGNKLNRFS